VTQSAKVEQEEARRKEAEKGSGQLKINPSIIQGQAKSTLIGRGGQFNRREWRRRLVLEPKGHSKKDSIKKSKKAR